MVAVGTLAIDDVHVAVLGENIADDKNLGGRHLLVQEGAHACRVSVATLVGSSALALIAEAIVIPAMVDAARVVPRKHANHSDTELDPLSTQPGLSLIYYKTPRKSTRVAWLFDPGISDQSPYSL